MRMYLDILTFILNFKSAFILIALDRDQDIKSKIRKYIFI